MANDIMLSTELRNNWVKMWPEIGNWFTFIIERLLWIFHWLRVGEQASSSKPISEGSGIIKFF